MLGSKFGNIITVQEFDLNKIDNVSKSHKRCYGVRNQNNSLFYLKEHYDLVVCVEDFIQRRNYRTAVSQQHKF